MLRRMPEPLQPVIATCHVPSALRETMPRWYSVRPAFLRIACAAGGAQRRQRFDAGPAHREQRVADEA